VIRILLKKKELYSFFYISFIMGGDIELVRNFNSELSSIYESKPPISKAKMAAITRYAVKALKYYKHVVHSVEKFLHKCRAEYKIAGLYVLDSIIRQSRHQFGAEKDLFGPRFKKNIKLLFQHIYQCPHEDKPKVVRVLNLWQKNDIYDPDVISPLIDMASTSSKVLQASISRHKKAKAAMVRQKVDVDHSFNEDMGGGDDYDDDDFQESQPPISFAEVSSSDVKKRRKASAKVSQEDEIQVLKAQLEQQRKQQELLQQQLQMQIMATKQQTLQMQFNQQSMGNKMQENNLNALASLIPTALQQQNPVNPNVNIISQIQELSAQLEQDKAALAAISAQEQQPPVIPQPAPLIQQSTVQPPGGEPSSQFLENFHQLLQTAKGIMQKDPRQQQSSQNDSLGQGLLEPPEEKVHDKSMEHQRSTRFDSDQQHHRHKDRHSLDQGDRRSLDQGDRRDRFDNGSRWAQDDRKPFNDTPPPQKKPLLDIYEELKFKTDFNRPQDEIRDMQDVDMQIDNDDLYDPTEGIDLTADTEDVVEMNAQQRKSEDELRQERDVNEKREREEHEKRERKRKDKSTLPAPLKSRLTVASLTLWVGRLPKVGAYEMIHKVFSDFGDVKNIDLIDMRGCAFITMTTRYDADKALRHLKHKRLYGYDVKMAWGQAKSLQEFSAFWDENYGCAFIPWGAFTEEQLKQLVEDCLVDEGSMPPGLQLPEVTHAPQEPDFHEEPPSSAPQELPPMPPPFMAGLPPGIMPPNFRPGFPPLPPPGMLPLGFRPPLPPNMMQMPPRMDGQRPRMMQGLPEIRLNDPRIRPNNQPNTFPFNKDIRPPFGGARMQPPPGFGLRFPQRGIEIRNPGTPPPPPPNQDFLPPASDFRNAGKPIIPEQFRKQPLLNEIPPLPVDNNQEIRLPPVLKSPVNTFADNEPVLPPWLAAKDEESKRVESSNSKNLDEEVKENRDRRTDRDDRRDDRRDERDNRDSYGRNRKDERDNRNSRKDDRYDRKNDRSSSSRKTDRNDKRDDRSDRRDRSYNDRDSDSRRSSRYDRDSREDKGRRDDRDRRSDDRSRDRFGRDRDSERGDRRSDRSQSTERHRSRSRDRSRQREELPAGIEAAKSHVRSEIIQVIQDDSPIEEVQTTSHREREDHDTVDITEESEKTNESNETNESETTELTTASVDKVVTQTEDSMDTNIVVESENQFDISNKDDAIFGDDDIVNTLVENQNALTADLDEPTADLHEVEAMPSVDQMPTEAASVDDNMLEVTELSINKDEEHSSNDGEIVEEISANVSDKEDIVLNNLETYSPTEVNEVTSTLPPAASDDGNIEHDLHVDKEATIENEAELLVETPSESNELDGITAETDEPMS